MRMRGMTVERPLGMPLVCCNIGVKAVIDCAGCQRTA